MEERFNQIIDEVYKEYLKTNEEIWYENYNNNH